MEYLDGCTISPDLRDDSVLLNGTIPGSPGQPSEPGEWSDGLDGGGGTEPECELSTIEPDRCYRNPPDPSEPVAPAVTLTDVAAFAPTLAPAVSEPGGWAIAGLPANLVGPSGAVVVDGVLLGSPAQVRFTPIMWRWDHGDGTTAQHGVPGATWSQLGVPELSATATSHVYGSPGVRRVSLAVVLVAEYRLGGGAWIPIPGSLSLPVSAFDLVVATADTVLVDRDCRAAPAGPGC